MRREDYERQPPANTREPYVRDHSGMSCHNVRVVAVSDSPNEPMDHLIVAADHDLLALPVFIVLATKEATDGLIKALITARNTVWPER